eukprot:scaffold95998_cov18-Prasinocladus_malaysianus.AAC.1
MLKKIRETPSIGLAPTRVPNRPVILMIIKSVEDALALVRYEGSEQGVRINRNRRKMLAFIIAHSRYH